MPFGGCSPRRTSPPPQADYDGIAAPYSLPGATASTDTPTEQSGMHYRVEVAGRFVCGSDRVPWPCEPIMEYRSGVADGTYAERSRNYAALMARFEALPPGSEAGTALYMAAQFIITQSPV